MTWIGDRIFNKLNCDSDENFNPILNIQRDLRVMDFVSMNIPRMFYKRIYFREIIYEAIDPKWIYIYIWIIYNVYEIRVWPQTSIFPYPYVLDAVSLRYFTFFYFSEKKKNNRWHQRVINDISCENTK